MKNVCFFLCIALAACDGGEVYVPGKGDPQIIQLQNEIAALQGQVSQMTAFATAPVSDWVNCTGAAAANALTLNICQGAKAANATDIMDIKAELALYAQNMNNTVTQLTNDLVALQNQVNTDKATEQADVANLQSQITTLNNNLIALNATVVAQGTTIASIQSQLASLTSTVANTVFLAEIGNENLSIGPLYESVEVATNRSSMNAYVNAFGPTLATPNNPLSATNNSGVMTITLTGTSTGLSVGSVINVSGATAGKGWLLAEINNNFTIVSVSTGGGVTTITVNMLTLAEGSGTLGGNSVTVVQNLGQGNAVIWTSGSGSSGLMTTTIGAKVNFYVCQDTTASQKGWVIYNPTVPLSTLANLTAVTCTNTASSCSVAAPCVRK